MTMFSPPTPGDISDLTSPAPKGGGVAVGTAWLEQIGSFVKQLPGGQAEAATTLASDTFTPTQAVHVLDTEGAGATDDLALIGQGSGVPSGWEVRIRCANAARVITVKHNTGGTGTIYLADETDLALNDPTMTLDLQRRGTAWYEVRRSYGGNKTALTAFINAATAALKGIVELATGTETITGTDATRAVTPDGLADLWEDGGDLSNGATITFPGGGSFRLITSTTTITAFAFSTSKAGRRVVCKLATDRTITANANIEIVPGGASIAGKSGDTFEVEDRGSGNARINWYQKADGKPVVAPATFIPRNWVSPDFRFTNNGSTPNTKIDYTAGQIVDDTNAEVVALSSGTVDLGTNGADGLDTGALATGGAGTITPYWLHVISNGTLNKVIASLSGTSPDLTGAAGYSVKALRAGLFLVDASGHVIPWIWADGRYMLKDPTQVPVLNTTASDGVAKNVATKLPTGVKLSAFVRMSAYLSANGNMAFGAYDPDGSSQSAGAYATAPHGDGASIGGAGAAFFKEVSTDTSAQIAIWVRGGTVSYAGVQLMGWRAPRH